MQRESQRSTEEKINSNNDWTSQTVNKKSLGDTTFSTDKKNTYIVACVWGKVGTGTCSTKQAAHGDTSNMLYTKSRRGDF